jgi:hypothetical protein
VAGTTPIFGGQAATPPPAAPTQPPAQHAAPASGSSIFGGQPAQAQTAPPLGSNAAYQQAGQTTHSIFGDILAETGQVASGASKALDAQGWLARKALTGGESDTDKQMTAIRHKIPGMDFVYDKVLSQQNPALGPNMGPLEGPIQAAGRGIDHFARGVIDAGIEGALDPLTYESYGGSAALKTIGKPLLGILARGAERTAVTRGISQALQGAAKQVKPATQAASTYFDWSAPAAQSGFDPEVIRGAAHKADFKGSRFQQHIMERVHNIVNGQSIKTVQGRVRPGTMLNDEERVNVQKALNGEAIDGEPAESVLTPKEKSATRQLRALTELDYRFRRQYATETAIHGNAPAEFHDELTQAFRSGKDPQIPEPTTVQPNLFRYQATAGEPEVSPRGGTFFNMDKPDKVYAGPADEMGGPNLVSRVNAAKNPLIVPKVTGLEVDVFTAMKGLSHKSLDQMYRITEKWTPTQKTRFLRSVGANDKDIAWIMDDPYEADARFTDRLIAEMAKKRGYDAIQHGNEFFALHPEATREAGQFQRVRQPYGPELPRQRLVNQELPPDYMALYREATTHMATPEKNNFSKAMTGDTERFKALPPELQAKAQAIRDAMHAKFSPPGMVGDVQELEPKQAAHYPPANQAAIEHATELKRLHTKIGAMIEDKFPYRENYMPSSHIGEQAGREGFTSNPTRWSDPRAQQRKDFYVSDPKDLERGFTAMASNAGRQRSAQVLHQLLGNVLDDPRVNKMFAEFVPPTGDKRQLRDYVRETWLGAIGYPRAGVVSLTPRHVFNMGDLAINTVPPEKYPQFIKEATELIPKLMVAKPREYAELLKDLPSAIGGGAAEKKPFFQKFAETFPNWMPGIGGKNVPVIGGKSIPLVSKWAYLNNKLVWASDAAFKIIYGRMMKESGETAGALGKLPEGMSDETASTLRAGGTASKRLVDYEHLAPIQKHLRYIAPFGTFRGGIPGAVAGGVTRNLPRAAFLNRATGGVMYGNKPQPGNEGWEAFLPTADVGRALTIGDKGTAGQRLAAGPAEFMRSTVGEPLKSGIGAVDPWMTYGEESFPTKKADGKWDPGTLAQYALSGAPGAPLAEAMLSAMGFSHFQFKGLANEAMRQTIGLQHQQP